MSRTQIELSEAAHNTTAVLFAAMPPQNSSSYLGSFPPPPDLIAVQNFRSIESLPVPAPALVPVSRNLRTSGSTFATNTQYPPSGTVSDHLDIRRSTERPKVAENFRSTEHAEMEAVPGRSLAHPLARVTYKAPKSSINTMVGFRQHIAHYLHLYRTELAIIAIIFVDVLAVCCEIMLESVCPHQKELTYWKKDLMKTYAIYENAYLAVHEWETALGWTSKSILFLFLLKEALLIFAVGMKNYFTKAPHLIDFSITVVAFGLEMGFFLSKEYDNNTQAATLTHLITVLLIWRVIRLLHGMMETTMAVQNHDHVLDDKEQMELKYAQSKGMVVNLQDRVRQLESTLWGDIAAANATWTREELSRVQRAFERSSHSATRVFSAAPSADVAVHDEASVSHAHSVNSQNTTSPDTFITFRSDYFCTWLSTDPDAKQFDVKYRSQAVHCGSMMLLHQMIERVDCCAKIIESVGALRSSLVAQHVAANRLNGFEDNHDHRYMFKQVTEARIEVPTLAVQQV